MEQIEIERDPQSFMAKQNELNWISMDYINDLFVKLSMGLKKVNHIS